MLAFITACQGAKPDIQTREVTYKSGDTIMKGYIAWDASRKGKRPGVLVVHEWWGHNEHARRSARRLARMGYTALAVDMYGNGKQAMHPKDAGKFAKAVFSNIDMAKARFMAAYKLLNDQPTVAKGQIAAIGYCFGGGVVLHMARFGLPLKGVASFHGSLGTGSPAKAGVVKARILVMTGGADKMVPKKSVETFRQEMRNAGIRDYEIVIYKGAMHSFTNPDADKMGKKFGLPIAYNEKADKKSWYKLAQFLKQIFMH
jgi:dienelactone hydrolase